MTDSSVTPIPQNTDVNGEDPDSGLPSTRELEIRQIALSESIRSFNHHNSEEAEQDTTEILTRALAFEEFLLGVYGDEDEEDEGDTDDGDEDDDE
jgi:hypothetical protein